MAKTYNRLEIDVNKKPNSIGIRPVQHDTKSRYLDVCLYENGVPINLTGEQVRITFRKADGSTFFNQGEVTDAAAGRCQFALTNEILSEAKAVEAQISVWNVGGQILSTQVFEIYVTAAIPWTDAVESENEYGVLVVLFQEIQDALDTMHKIAAAFGEPGDKAAEYGVDTFWGILETLAGRGDVESSLQKGIKAYLNSTVGTSGFQSLDKMLEQNKNMVSGYINETGARYVPSWDTPYFLIGSTIDDVAYTSITTNTTYTWDAKYAGEIIVAYYGSSNKSSYLSTCEILKNTEQITRDWLDTTGVAENCKKSYLIHVKKGDVITIKINPYSSSRPASMGYLIIGYHIESKTTLNIIKSIQQGSVNTSNGGVSVKISPVNPNKSIPFVTGAGIKYFDGHELILLQYVSSSYADTRSGYWSIIEFY